MATSLSAGTTLPNSWLCKRFAEDAPGHFSRAVKRSYFVGNSGFLTPIAEEVFGSAAGVLGMHPLPWKIGRAKHPLFTEFGLRLHCHSSGRCPAQPEGARGPSRPLAAYWIVISI